MPGRQQQQEGLQQPKKNKHSINASNSGMLAIARTPAKAGKANNSREASTNRNANHSKNPKTTGKPATVRALGAEGESQQKGRQQQS